MTPGEIHQAWGSLRARGLGMLGGGEGFYWLILLRAGKARTCIRGIKLTLGNCPIGSPKTDDRN